MNGDNSDGLQVSAPDPEGAGWMGAAITALGAALSALAAWAWNHTHSRIKDVDGKADKKADKDQTNGELIRHRDYIGKLFDKIEEMGDKTEVRFSSVEARAADRHIELMKAIHERK